MEYSGEIVKRDVQNDDAKNDEIPLIPFCELVGVVVSIQFGFIKYLNIYHIYHKYHDPIYIANTYIWY
jgi:hypothetical protein